MTSSILKSLCALALTGFLIAGIETSSAWAQATDLECNPAGCVDSDDIADGSILPIDIVPGSINATTIANQSISANKLVPGSVNATTIANNTIGPNKLIPGSINTTTIANQSVTANKIADGSIISSKIANGAVTASKIDPNLFFEDLSITTYSGFVSWFQGECTDSGNVFLYGSSLNIAVNTQTVSGYSGTLNGTYSVPGYSLFLTGTFDLTSYPFGKFSGTASIDAYENGIYSTSSIAQIMASSTQLGQMMSLAIKGQIVAGESCKFVGNGLVQAPS